MVMGASFFSELFKFDPFLPSLVSDAIFLFFFSLLFTYPKVPLTCLEDTYIKIIKLSITHKRSYFSSVVSFRVLPAVLLVPIGAVACVAMPAKGMLATMWILTSIWAGHTVGIFIFSRRKQSSKKNSKQNSSSNLQSTEIHVLRKVLGVTKNVVELIIFILIILGFFIVWDVVFESQQFASLTEQCSLVFPFSVTTIFEPGMSSVLLLIGHILVIGEVYYLSIQQIINKIAR